MAPWTREILRLVTTVNGRRDEPVPLAAMAALAHRSRFDLHRRFRGVVGETPRTYVSRVRLARAAADLLATDRLVSAVAFDHGFASHEVFTRSFTRHFGLSPRAYRARGLHGGNERTTTVHAAAVASAAPCVGLYRLTSTGRSTAVSVDIAVQELPAVHALVMRRRVSREDVASMLGDCLPAVFAYAQRVQRAPAAKAGTLRGFPLCRPPDGTPGPLATSAGVR